MSLSRIFQIKVFIFFLFLFSISLFLFPSNAFATTEVYGSIPDGTVWSEVGSKKNKFEVHSKEIVDYELVRLKETNKKMGKYLTEQTRKIY